MLSAALWSSQFWVYPDPPSAHTSCHGICDSTGWSFLCQDGFLVLALCRWHTTMRRSLEESGCTCRCRVYRGCRYLGESENIVLDTDGWCSDPVLVEAVHTSRGSPGKVVMAVPPPHGGHTCLGCLPASETSRGSFAGPCPKNIKLGAIGFPDQRNWQPFLVSYRLGSWKGE